MFSVKDKIFGYFGRFYKRADTNKDTNDKGTLERYHEALATDLDNNIVFKINDLVDDVLIPSTVLEEFLPYLENNWGGSVDLNNDLELKRKVLKFIVPIYQVRGSKRSYEILLKLLGFHTVNIVELEPLGGFDSPTTFDSEDRTFDSACPPCSKYEIELTGSITVDMDVISSIYNVVEFCEPLNAILSKISYNGEELPDQIIINIFVNSDGNLEYQNGEDETLTITINNDGDLVIEGDTENQYSIDEEGDLIYTP